MPFRFTEGEILLINKPYSWTSFDVVNNFRMFLKSKLGIKKIKIGHAGTLDPLATGLLILCTGKFTKKIEEFKEFDKEYTGVFTLGATTPTFDMESPLDSRFDVDLITNQQILDTAESFTGSQMQVPPKFSAVKIRGRRAYDYARQDEEVQLSAKQIEISAFEITRIEMPEIHFRIACSKGTYIRALARDFGAALKNGAYLSALCRTRIGPYHLRDAWELDTLKTSLLPG
ncbi:MAG: tRNA pseudouridine(55) synthase TruB [Bacteroidales bacterium]|nr:tRNA pseudouridine(55) synthase TruB [Bacteroidales bacterium]